MLRRPLTALPARVPLAVLSCALLLAPALRAEPEATLEVARGGDAKSPFIFHLKSGAETLCNSGGYKSAGKAGKAARQAKLLGVALKNFMFQKKTDATGDHHWWELKEPKKKGQVLCTSDTVADEARLEQSAGAAAKAFAQAKIKE